MSRMLAAKIAGGAVFVVLLGINAAQSWADPSFVLPAAARFDLFIAAAVFGGAQLLLPRPGEPAASGDPSEEPRTGLARPGAPPAA